MQSIIKLLWLIPVLPLAAAGVGALLKRERRRASALLAIGAMTGSLVLSLAAFVATLPPADLPRAVCNFDWLDFGTASLQLGWLLDPLAAVMLVMVSFVSLLIFVYSTGYMASDENFTRFFCFMSLFAAAMLGILIANSLLLLFACWELVGLSSYLLIGFWYQKPAAAAAAKKAFITTRIGDIGLLIGMLWLYARAGTLVFYDRGHGCLEQSALSQLAGQTILGGMTISTAISLLIFCGAAGKSGQVPLHVWLPDAMEGPTPVSALIHAATMVAAGIYLVARVYPLMDGTAALEAVTWVGAITAVFAAAIAVAQNDIKRILAYSTVSQLGYMMMGLGVGGVAVGMFHLITHAFFKALLFLGAGSVIFGCHHEQDIRQMGGLRKLMPLTFAAYAIGMMALCGVPLAFSGFWSKDAILTAARQWSVSSVPFYLGMTGMFLTAFYMTRQMFYVFFGRSNPAARPAPESPAVMTIPLMVLAALAVLAGLLGTPAWPWFDAYLKGGPASVDFSKLVSGRQIAMTLLSATVIATAMAFGVRLYRATAAQAPRPADPLEAKLPFVFACLRRKLFFDEIYDATFVRLNRKFAQLANWMDHAIWGGLVALASKLAVALARRNSAFDERAFNARFDATCDGLKAGGKILTRWQSGQAQRYLRVIGLAFCALLLLMVWGCK